MRDETMTPRERTIAAALGMLHDARFNEELQRRRAQGQVLDGIKVIGATTGGAAVHEQIVLVWAPMKRSWWRWWK
jgi:hypothetical protein